MLMPPKGLRVLGGICRLGVLGFVWAGGIRWVFAMELEVEEGVAVLAIQRSLVAAEEFEAGDVGVVV